MSKMSGERHLYVIGYPSVIADKAVCSDAISALERNRANDIVNYLNAAVAQAASNAGAYYVDVTDAFVVGGKDYRLCGNQSPTAVNTSPAYTSQIIRVLRPTSPSTFARKVSGTPIGVGLINLIPRLPVTQLIRGWLATSRFSMR